MKTAVAAEKTKSDKIRLSKRNNNRSILIRLKPLLLTALLALIIPAAAEESITTTETPTRYCRFTGDKQPFTIELTKDLNRRISIAGGTLNATVVKSIDSKFGVYFLILSPSADTKFDVTSVQDKVGFPLASGGIDGISLGLTANYAVYISVNGVNIVMDCEVIPHNLLFANQSE